MTTVKEILENASNEQVIALLKEKSLCIPAWLGINGLADQYDPQKHPVMDKATYPDVTSNDGRLECVTRVPLNFQKLAVKRMTELCCGIPVKRIYTPENDTQKEIARCMEKIYERTRIDSVNNERLRMLFAGCEVMTLWYAVEQPNTIYGFESKLKLRCRNFSPMQGDELYPLFDETGDLIALSVAYKRKVAKKWVSFFDVYTQDRHIFYSNEGGTYDKKTDEPIELGKIPAIYMWRPEPIWEDTSTLVYEMEWSLSRNGNYLRKNSKPVFVVSADEAINYGEEEDEKKEYRAIVQLPTGASANYVTWNQAIESLKYQIDTLRSLYFTQLQLPDWSYEKMSQQALSGESRKQMFIDAQLKVGDESGRLIEFFDREVNVVRTFMTAMMGEGKRKDIEALPVTNVVTPYTITDENDKITNLMTATGGKQILSQKEAIQILGWSDDADATLEQINKESNADVFAGGYE